jgi:hypothetical protein
MVVPVGAEAVRRARGAAGRTARRGVPAIGGTARKAIGAQAKPGRTVRKAALAAAGGIHVARARASVPVARAAAATHAAVRPDLVAGAVARRARVPVTVAAVIPVAAPAAGTALEGKAAAGKAVLVARPGPAGVPTGRALAARARAVLGTTAAPAARVTVLVRAAAAILVGRPAGATAPRAEAPAEASRGPVRVRRGSVLALVAVIRAAEPAAGATGRAAPVAVLRRTRAAGAIVLAAPVGAVRRAVVAGATVLRPGAVLKARAVDMTVPGLRAVPGRIGAVGVIVLGLRGVLGRTGAVGVSVLAVLVGAARKVVAIGVTVRKGVPAVGVIVLGLPGVLGTTGVAGVTVRRPGGVRRDRAVGVTVRSPGGVLRRSTGVRVIVSAGSGLVTGIGPGGPSSAGVRGRTGSTSLSFRRTSRARNWTLRLAWSCGRCRRIWRLG